MSVLYKTEPLKLWRKAKELRLAYYENYARAHEKKGLRWAGGAWAFDAIPRGLGDDVWSLTSEPYAASIAGKAAFSIRCQDAAEKNGYARDLCSYMRNYWGSMILGEYAFPAFSKTWPKPDFIFQTHICCSHAKWHQVASELDGGVPMACIDVSAGPTVKQEGEKVCFHTVPRHAIDYVVDQCLDAIEFLEKTTGRRYCDGLLRKAVFNHMRSTTAWARICALQKTIPAPLEEKTMYSLYVLATLAKASSWCADFYEELYGEVKDRVERGIAAIAHERMRIMTDTQPPWAFLDFFRYLEEFGCVSVGSLYTFGLEGQWTMDEKSEWKAADCPQNIDILPINRRDLLAVYIEFELKKLQWQHFYNPTVKSIMMQTMVRDWKIGGVLFHFNRGCEGLSLGIAENALALQRAGIPIMNFEGNMGDSRENDKAHIYSRIDLFMETLGLKRDIFHNRANRAPGAYR